MKVNLDIPVVWDGKEIGRAGEILAQQLAFTHQGQAQKFVAWAEVLKSGSVLSLNAEEINSLKPFVASLQLPNITKAVILDELDKHVPPPKKVVQNGVQQRNPA